MNAPPLDQIIKAVLDWQHRQPLAERLSADAVHSIGLVALPFLRASDDAPLPSSAWQRLLQRLRRGGAGGEGGGYAAFTERFIPGLAPQRAAAFALRHGVEAIDGADDWPQRRIEVDDAAAVAGGWPFERWLLSAAVEGRHGRQRVLIGLQPPLQVLGRRVLDRRRLLAIGLLLALPLAAGAWWLSRAEPAPAPPELRVRGAVLAASAPVSAPSTTAGSAVPSLPPQAAPSEPASAATIDIRPRLGPQRRAPMPAASAPPASAAVPEAAAAEPSAAASAPASGTGDPERVGPRLPSSGPVVALVSPVFAKREEAEAMLARMRAHLAQTGGAALEGEVFEAKPGYRAAVWPFASREEAQLINATMIARGWKTRAVDF